MGCVAVGATVYFGSDDATQQIVEVSNLFQQAHELGMATVLWCYLRNKAFKVGQARTTTSRPISPVRRTTSASR